MASTTMNYRWFLLRISKNKYALIYRINQLEHLHVLNERMLGEREFSGMIQLVKFIFSDFRSSAMTVADASV